MKNVKIYQLLVEHKAKFMRLSFVKENNIMPKLEEYNIVWEGVFSSDSDLNDIYTVFNTKHPAGFKGHSLSVSDVVEIDGKYYYCDSFGWKEISFTATNEPKKAYIVKAYGSSTYIAKYNTREEALAKANVLNDDYYQHKIWNVEEIIDEDASETAKVIDLEENGNRCAGETPEIKIRIAEARRMEKYTQLKNKYPNTVLLFRCGNFYETYCDDAVSAAKILGITLCYRHGFENKKGNEMAGFPAHALDTYLPKLVRAGRRVAICDPLDKEI